MQYVSTRRLWQDVCRRIWFACVGGCGLVALETVMAYHGTVDKRYSWNIGRPAGSGKTLVAEKMQR